MTVTPFNLHFVGGGNMAASLIGGLIESGFPANCIQVTDPNDDIQASLKERFGVVASEVLSLGAADAVVLCVKPQIMPAVLPTLVPAGLSEAALVISVAAGVTLNSMAKGLGSDRSQQSIIRAMPNTPALIQKGLTVLFANEAVTEAQKKQADLIGAAVGAVGWVDHEALLDPVTALSGSGPAYYFLFMEAMMQAAEAQGLTQDQARDWVLKTAEGAVALAASSDVDVAELRRRVTSPRGTTEAALNTFIERGLHDTVARAMMAASDRARELAAEFGNE